MRTAAGQAAAAKLITTGRVDPPSLLIIGRAGTSLHLKGKTMLVQGRFVKAFDLTCATCLFEGELSIETDKGRTLLIFSCETCDYERVVSIKHK